MSDPKKVLRVKEAGELLSVTTRTLHRWDVDGTLKARRFPNGRKYYLQEDIDVFLEGGKVEEQYVVRITFSSCTEGV